MKGTSRSVSRVLRTLPRWPAGIRSAPPLTWPFTIGRRWTPTTFGERLADFLQTRCGLESAPALRGRAALTPLPPSQVLSGKVIGQCLPRHRHEEFLTFLPTIDREVLKGPGVHLILDNYATHKHPNVERWLKQHKRFHLHFTPTSSSWLNQVERWFRDLTDKNLRRGIFGSVPDLIASIEKYLAFFRPSGTRPPERP